MSLLTSRGRNEMMVIAAWPNGCKIIATVMRYLQQQVCGTFIYFVNTVYFCPIRRSSDLLLFLSPLNLLCVFFGLFSFIIRTCEWLSYTVVVAITGGLPYFCRWWVMWWRPSFLSASPLPVCCMYTLQHFAWLFWLCVKNLLSFCVAVFDFPWSRPGGGGSPFPSLTPSCRLPWHHLPCTGNHF